MKNKAYTKTALVYAVKKKQINKGDGNLPFLFISQVDQDYHCKRYQGPKGQIGQQET